MTWCKDIERDAAVRAAEDGRDRPLPTLGEAIVRAFGFDKASAQRACDKVNSWPEDVQKDCRFVLGNLLEQGVEALQALVEAWRYGKGLLAARYPDMIPKTGSASSTVNHENKGESMATKSEMQAADYRAEAIARPFADAAERSSTVSETGEGQSGMRTERVTLEITYNPNIFPPTTRWAWESLLRLRSNDGESVRVVEETHFDDLAQVAMERDAAIRERDEAWQIAQTFESLCLGEHARNKVLKARVDELEARTSTAGEGSCDADAASGSGVIRDMIDILRSNTADADEKHAAMSTLVEAVCPGWALTQAASGGGESIGRKLAERLGRFADRLESGELDMPSASGGGEGEPVVDDSPFVWAVIQKGRDHSWCFAFRRHKDQAQEEFPPSEFVHVPLYRQPPQPRGWLTSEEREAVEWVCDLGSPLKSSGAYVINSLRSLLARSSPPEVVLPENPYTPSKWREGFEHALRIVRNELVNAGVDVKEVGRE